MLKSILGFLFLKLLEFIYTKVSDWRRLKKTVDQKRQMIDELKSQLRVAETENERILATREMARHLNGR